ncbi:unnamed protein product, partial [Brassica oleracea]
MTFHFVLLAEFFLAFVYLVYACKLLFVSCMDLKFIYPFSLYIYMDYILGRQ